ncbi:helix-turn-helix domain-containing protein [Gemmiger formicilis]|uniref:helix-turn-helix domain-containing protein n=1 Tax=Gemmiger formicilis TaxID=745368 RepID=UPI003993DA36
MEKTYNPALIQRTQRYMETHSISQNQFAAKVNLSSAALSSYLNQKYKGSVEAVERQLSEFFKLDEEAEAAAEKTAIVTVAASLLCAGVKCIVKHFKNGG